MYVVTAVCVVQEGRKVQSFSGFKGKGFRFDETEAQLADERKKLQKAALGLHDSDEEETALDVSCRGSLSPWGVLVPGVITTAQ